MTKTVALSDEAYLMLDTIRYEDESFSKTVMRIVREKHQPLCELKGIWKDHKETEGIFKKIHTERKKNFLREATF